MAPEDERDLTRITFTCEGNLHDPDFSDRFQSIVSKLKSILYTSKKKQPFQVRKIEPWNSVRVTISIPKEAAQRLRLLAQQGSNVLRQLGILSVQVEGDQVISLTLAGRYNEPQEVILRQTNDNSGSSPSTSSNSSLCSTSSSSSSSSSVCSTPLTSLSSSNSITPGGGGGGGSISLLTSSASGTMLNNVSATTLSGPSGVMVSLDTLSSTTSSAFRSPNVVAPGGKSIPFPPKNNNSQTRSILGGPFPFASMTHAAHTIQRSETVNNNNNNNNSSVNNGNNSNIIINNNNNTTTLIPTVGTNINNNNSTNPNNSNNNSNSSSFSSAISSSGNYNNNNLMHSTATTTMVSASISTSSSTANQISTNLPLCVTSGTLVQASSSTSSTVTAANIKVNVNQIQQQQNHNPSTTINNTQSSSISAPVHNKNNNTNNNNNNNNNIVNSMNVVSQPVLVTAVVNNNNNNNFSSQNINSSPIDNNNTSSSTSSFNSNNSNNTFIPPANPSNLVVVLNNNNNTSVNFSKPSLVQSDAKLNPSSQQQQHHSKQTVLKTSHHHHHHHHSSLMTKESTPPPQLPTLPAQLTSSGKPRQFLINPLTGHLEPMPSESSSDSEGDGDDDDNNKLTGKGGGKGRGRVVVGTSGLKFKGSPYPHYQQQQQLHMKSTSNKGKDNPTVVVGWDKLSLPPPKPVKQITQQQQMQLQQQLDNLKFNSRMHPAMISTTQSGLNSPSSITTSATTITTNTSASASSCNAIPSTTTTTATSATSLTKETIHVNNTNITPTTMENKIKKIRLKLEKNELSTTSYKMDVSYGKKSEKVSSSNISTSSSSNIATIGGIPSFGNLATFPSTSATTTTTTTTLPIATNQSPSSIQQSPRVPPLHISLRGKNAAVVVSPRRDDANNFPSTSSSSSTSMSGSISVGGNNLSSSEKVIVSNINPIKSSSSSSSSSSIAIKRTKIRLKSTGESAGGNSDKESKKSTTASVKNFPQSTNVGEEYEDPLKARLKSEESDSNNSSSNNNSSSSSSHYHQNKGMLNMMDATKLSSSSSSSASNSDLISGNPGSSSTMATNLNSISNTTSNTTVTAIKTKKHRRKSELTSSSPSQNFTYSQSTFENLGDIKNSDSSGVLPNTNNSITSSSSSSTVLQEPPHSQLMKLLSQSQQQQQQQQQLQKVVVQDDHGEESNENIKTIKTPTVINPSNDDTAFSLSTTPTTTTDTSLLTTSSTATTSCDTEKDPKNSGVLLSSNISKSGVITVSSSETTSSSSSISPCYSTTTTSTAASSSHLLFSGGQVKDNTPKFSAPVANTVVEQNVNQIISDSATLHASDIPKLDKVLSTQVEITSTAIPLSKSPLNTTSTNKPIPGLLSLPLQTSSPSSASTSSTSQQQQQKQILNHPVTLSSTVKTNVDQVTTTSTDNTLIKSIITTTANTKDTVLTTNTGFIPKQSAIISHLSSDLMSNRSGSSISSSNNSDSVVADNILLQSPKFRHSNSSTIPVDVDVDRKTTTTSEPVLSSSSTTTVVQSMNSSILNQMLTGKQPKRVEEGQQKVEQTLTNVKIPLSTTTDSSEITTGFTTISRQEEGKEELSKNSNITIPLTSSSSTNFRGVQLQNLPLNVDDKLKLSVVSESAQGSSISSSSGINIISKEQRSVVVNPTQDIEFGAKVQLKKNDDSEQFNCLDNRIIKKMDVDDNNSDDNNIVKQRESPPVTISSGYINKDSSSKSSSGETVSNVNEKMVLESDDLQEKQEVTSNKNSENSSASMAAPVTSVSSSYTTSTSSDASSSSPPLHLMTALSMPSSSTSSSSSTVSSSKQILEDSPSLHSSGSIPTATTSGGGGGGEDSGIDSMDALSEKSPNQGESPARKNENDHQFCDSNPPSLSHSSHSHNLHYHHLQQLHLQKNSPVSDRSSDTESGSGSIKSISTIESLVSDCDMNIVTTSSSSSLLPVVEENIYSSNTSVVVESKPSNNNNNNIVTTIPSLQNINETLQQQKDIDSSTSSIGGIQVPSSSFTSSSSAISTTTDISTLTNSSSSSLSQKDSSSSFVVETGAISCTMTKNNITNVRQFTSDSTDNTLPSSSSSSFSSSVITTPNFDKKEEEEKSVVGTTTITPTTTTKKSESQIQLSEPLQSAQKLGITQTGSDKLLLLNHENSSVDSSSSSNVIPSDVKIKPDFKNIPSSSSSFKSDETISIITPSKIETISQKLNDNIISKPENKSSTFVDSKPSKLEPCSSSKLDDKSITKAEEEDGNKISGKIFNTIIGGTDNNAGNKSQSYSVKEKVSLVNREVEKLSKLNDEFIVPLSSSSSLVEVTSANMLPANSGSSGSSSSSNNSLSLTVEKEQQQQPPPPKESSKTESKENLSAAKSISNYSVTSQQQQQPQSTSVSAISNPKLNSTILDTSNDDVVGKSNVKVEDTNLNKSTATVIKPIIDSMKYESQVGGGSKEKEKTNLSESSPSYLSNCLPSLHANLSESINVKTSNFKEDKDAKLHVTSNELEKSGHTSGGSSSNCSIVAQTIMRDEKPQERLGLIEKLGEGIEKSNISVVNHLDDDKSTTTSSSSTVKKIKEVDSSSPLVVMASSQKVHSKNTKPVPTITTEGGVGTKEDIVSTGNALAQVEVRKESSSSSRGNINKMTAGSSLSSVISKIKSNMNINEKTELKTIVHNFDDTSKSFGQNKDVNYKKEEQVVTTLDQNHRPSSFTSTQHDGNESEDSSLKPSEKIHGDGKNTESRSSKVEEAPSSSGVLSESQSKFQNIHGKSQTQTQTITTTVAASINKDTISSSDVSTSSSILQNQLQGNITTTTNHSKGNIGPTRIVRSSVPTQQQTDHQQQQQQQQTVVSKYPIGMVSSKPNVSRNVIQVTTTATKVSTNTISTPVSSIPLNLNSSGTAGFLNVNNNNNNSNITNSTANVGGSPTAALYAIGHLPHQYHVLPGGHKTIKLVTIPKQNQNQLQSMVINNSSSTATTTANTTTVLNRSSPNILETVNIMTTSRSSSPSILNAIGGVSSGGLVKPKTIGNSVQTSPINLSCGLSSPVVTPSGNLQLIPISTSSVATANPVKVLVSSSPIKMQQNLIQMVKGQILMTNQKPATAIRVRAPPIISPSPQINQEPTIPKLKPVIIDNTAIKKADTLTKKFTKSSSSSTSSSNTTEAIKTKTTATTTTTTTNLPSTTPAETNSIYEHVDGVQVIDTEDSNEDELYPFVTDIIHDEKDLADVLADENVTEVRENGVGTLDGPYDLSKSCSITTSSNTNINTTTVTNRASKTQNTPHLRRTPPTNLPTLKDESKNSSNISSNNNNNNSNRNKNKTENIPETSTTVTATASDLDLDKIDSPIPAMRASSPLYTYSNRSTRNSHSTSNSRSPSPRISDDSSNIISSYHPNLHGEDQEIIDCLSRSPSQPKLSPQNKPLHLENDNDYGSPTKPDLHQADDTYVDRRRRRRRRRSSSSSNTSRSSSSRNENNSSAPQLEQLSIEIPAVDLITTASTTTSSTSSMSPATTEESRKSTRSTRSNTRLVSPDITAFRSDTPKPTKFTSKPDALLLRNSPKPSPTGSLKTHSPGLGVIQPSTSTRSSPIPSQHSINSGIHAAIHTPGRNSPIGARGATFVNKRKRQESDSSSNASKDENSEETKVDIDLNSRPGKRRCSENAAELIKACIGIEDTPKRNTSLIKKSEQQEMKNRETATVSGKGKKPMMMSVVVEENEEDLDTIDILSRGRGRSSRGSSEDRSSSRGSSVHRTIPSKSSTKDDEHKDVKANSRVNNRNVGMKDNKKEEKSAVGRRSNRNAPMKEKSTLAVVKTRTNIRKEPLDNKANTTEKGTTPSTSPENGNPRRKTRSSVAVGMSDTSVSSFKRRRISKDAKS